MHCICTEVVVLLKEEDTASEVAGYSKPVKHFVDLPPPVVFDDSDRGLPVVAILIRVGCIGTTSTYSPGEIRVHITYVCTYVSHLQLVPANIPTVCTYDLP